MPAKLKPRLPSIPDDKLTARQKELMEAIRSGPRGRVSQNGPFGVYLHAPEFGDLTQKLGAHCRYKTSVPPRLALLGAQGGLRPPGGGSSDRPPAQAVGRGVIRRVG